MNRKKLIQEIFRKTNFDTYLEIGCSKGKSFLPVRCKTKIAVDPDFKITRTRKLLWFIKNPYNVNCKYFEETSDDFFRLRVDLLNSCETLDVVLVDGLHTFRDSLNDVLNSLNYLNPNGIIIIHDCLPPDNTSAMPAMLFPNLEEQNVEGWTSEWYGDVWKSIIYLRSNFPELLDVSVIDSDYGLGIVRIKNKIDGKLKIDEKSFNAIDQMTYKEMIESKESVLNLKSSDYARKIIEEISAHNN
ncbi:MAG: class I SAM-dependent methyltransferase [Bacteroidia bacterium]|nr:class I SAM-dependent methyltransferase [Bacteroidia bacterium]